MVLFENCHLPNQLKDMIFFFNVYFLKGWWKGRCFHLLVQLWQVWEAENITKFEIRKLLCWSSNETIYLQLQWVKGENWSPYCHCIHVSLPSKQKGDQIYLNKTKKFPRSSNRLNKTANVHSSTTKPPWSVSKTSSSTTLASKKSTSETTKASKPPKSAKTTKSPTQPSSTKKVPQTSRAPPSSNSLDGPRIEPLDPPELLEPSKLQSKSHGLALKSKAALVYMLLLCFNALSRWCSKMLPLNQ